MISRKNLLISVCIIILNFVHQTFVYSQSKIDKFSQYYEGLSDNNVTAILQDKFGFMWFATRNGLNRFDGYSFKIYENNPSDSNTISYNWITDIIEDPEGNLWIGTFGGGLNYFDRKHDKFIRYIHTNSPNSISSNLVLKLYYNSENKLFIGTDNGIDIFENGKFLRPEGSSPILDNQYVSTILEDDYENIWIGTMGNGLFMYNPKLKKVDRYKNIPGNDASISDNNIRSGIKDSRGNLWFGTLQNGLNLLKKDRKGNISFIHYLHNPSDKSSLTNNSILAIFEDKHRNLWIGTENGGLDLFNVNSKKFIHHTNDPDNENSIASNSIWSIYEDNSGSMWFGTFNKGLSKWDPNREKFSYFDFKENKRKQSHTTVTCFFEYNPNKIIVGTDGFGYYIWDRKTKTHQNKAENNVILSIVNDSKNKTWLGTWGKGILVTSKNTFENPSFNTIFNYENVMTLLKDNDENMWIGTWGSGLHVAYSNSPKVDHFYTDDKTNSISSQNIFFTFQDSRNNIWIATINGLNKAILYKDSYTFKRYMHINGNHTSLSSNTILSLFEDSRRNLWIGTGFGLNRYDYKNDNFVRITDSILTNKEIKAILEDNNGKLWISTDNGLVMYNPEAKKSVLFDKSDGVNVKGFSVNACLKTSDNLFMFGGNNGMITFYPDSVKTNTYIPPVYITDFKIFNKSVIPGKSNMIDENILYTKEIELSYKDAVFSFEFVALNFTHPEKNRYAYRMDGLEKDWNYVGNQRYASYSNLSPGEYTFMVKASNNDGVWNEEPTKIIIIVTPPIWKTIWFKIIAFIILSYIVYLIYQQRIRTIKERLIVQEKIYENKQIEAEKEIIKLQNDKLDSELDYKNKELASTTMHIEHKNEKLINVRDQLNELITSNNTTPGKKLKEIVKEIENELENENNWESFERSFNLVHDDFLKRFAEAFPKITHKDLKMCALIRMNLSNKEISNMLNISLRSVESSRYRIRKKMDIQSEINLNDFIMRF